MPTLTSERAKAIRQQADKHYRLYLQKMKELKAGCPHPEDRVEYFPDPSGNGDSANICRLCNLNVKR